MSSPRRPTLADVARAAGVSTTLVSLVMRDLPGASPENRERVLREAERIGYQPDRRAQLLRSGRSRLLGVVFNVDVAFHGHLVTGLYAAADAAGYELSLSAMTSGRDEQRAIEDLLRDRCEAVVLMSMTSRPRELVDLAEKLPLVVLGRSVRESSVEIVRTDDVLGSRLAVDHLVTLGHERIAHVDGGRTPGSAERRRGYETAMQDHGLGDLVRVVPGGNHDEDGATAAESLLGDPPTAVVAFNDRVAIGVLDAVRRSGRDVPRDLSVVGFDDISASRLRHVDLTTIAQDSETITRLAVERAADRIEGRPVERREQVVAPELVIRGTTTIVPR